MSGAINNECIRRARDHFRAHGEAGWARNSMALYGNRECLVTALRGDGYEAAYWKVREAIIARGGDPEAGFMFRWNDAPARTFAEVLAVVEAADLALNGAD